MIFQFKGSCELQQCLNLVLVLVINRQFWDLIFLKGAGYLSYVWVRRVWLIQKAPALFSPLFEVKLRDELFPVSVFSFAFFFFQN